MATNERNYHDALCEHPEIEVQLTGEDGNAFAILGRVTRAMKKVGLPQAEIDRFVSQATSADYNHLLRTVMDWVTVR